MTLEQALDILANYNEWRRGAEIPQPNPTEIGLAIDFILKFHKDV